MARVKVVRGSMGGSHWTWSSADAAVRQAHQAGAGFGGGVDDSVQDDAGVFHGGSDRGRIQAACRRLASEPTPAMRIS